MALGILTNVAATYAENNLNQTQGSLQSVLQQLSSGSRINSGADDAAGLSVADGLHANEAALTQSAQNATNGVGLLQTADGALSQVTNLLAVGQMRQVRVDLVDYRQQFDIVVARENRGQDNRGARSLRLHNTHYSL